MKEAQSSFGLIEEERAADAAALFVLCLEEKLTKLSLAKLYHITYGNRCALGQLFSIVRSRSAIARMFIECFMLIARSRALSLVFIFVL